MMENKECDYLITVFKEWIEREKIWSQTSIMGKAHMDRSETIEIYNMVIDALENQPKWILCEDELPPQNTDVIITVVDKPCRFTKVGWLMGETWISDNDVVCGNVIAWMSLPESYEEVNTNV